VFDDLRSRGIPQADIARGMGITTHALWRRIVGLTRWNADEIADLHKQLTVRHVSVTMSELVSLCARRDSR